MTRSEKVRLEQAMEVRRVRTEMALWGFSEGEIEEEVERVRRLGLRERIR